MGKTTHGLNGTPEHAAWKSMKNRCNRANPAESYVGVTICQEWQDSFPAFLRDMGPKPGPEYSIERLRSNEGYYPDNCEWATRTAQSRNRPGFVRPLTFQGKTQLVVEWAEEIGIKPKTLYQRLRNGWPVEKVLGAPLYTR
jgi:hypothetical protein